MVKVNRVEEVQQTVTVPQVTNSVVLQKHLLYLINHDADQYFLAEGNLTYSANCVEAKGWFIKSKDACDKTQPKESKVSLTIPLNNIKFVKNLNFKSR